MTRLTLNSIEYVNGVGKRPVETSRHPFPGCRIQSVTNGVHPSIWMHPVFAKLNDARLPVWCIEPELLVRGDYSITDETIWLEAQPEIPLTNAQVAHDMMHGEPKRVMRKLMVRALLLRR